MKRLKESGMFISGMFCGASFVHFTLAVIRHDAKYVITGLVMALICAIILYQEAKTEKKTKKN